MTESVKKIVNLAGTVALLTADLNVLIPGTATPSGWVVTFAGPAHEKTIALNDQASRDQLKKNAEIERAQVNGKKWKGEDISPTESRRKTVASVIGRIIGWTPVDFGNGEIEFDEDAAIKLFMDPAMGNYFGQFVDFLTAEKAFLKVSANG